MILLSVELASKSFQSSSGAETFLFQNISFGIDQGQKVALVGVNGSGKTTLLKALAGKEPLDDGKVVFRNDVKVAFAEQNPAFEAGDTITTFIFNTDNAILNLINEYEHLLQDPNSPVAQKKLPQLIEQIDLANAWDYESQVKQILGRFGLYNLDQPMEELSGGQRKRVALAKVLIEKPDFLILDEPTNHLDLDTIEWLENYIASSAMTLLLVTHDRYFLERTTNEIIELDKGNLFWYKGNYAYFLEKKAERLAQQETEVSKAQNLMRKELDWMRRQPKARGTKAKYRVDAFGELKEKANQKTDNSALDLSIQMRRQGGKILEAEKISKKYDQQTLVDQFSYVFKKNDKVGMIGKNGVGKSTLLNILTGDIVPDSGQIEKGATTVFGYYRQEGLVFQEGQRVIDVVKEVAEVIEIEKGRVITASQFLQYFLFPPEKQYTMVSRLSGGEKRRLQLLRVLMKNPNFLILDEPTNDLDLITLNVLEEFLENYSGSLILVSHDRYFMDKLINHMFVFEGDGVINDFPGNYTDFRERKQMEGEQRNQEEKPKKSTKEPAPTKPNIPVQKVSYAEKREYELLTKEIDALEVEKQKLSEKMNEISLKAAADPDYNPHQDLTDISEKIAKIGQMLEEKSDRWLTLAEKVDG